MSAVTNNTEPENTEVLPTCIFHPKETTRISCSQCESPICTKCLNYCEVGIKCKNCLRQIRCHVYDAEPRDYLLGCGLAVLFSAAFQFYSSVFMVMGYFGFFIVFLMAQIIGEGVHKMARYKLGRNIKLAVTLASVAGLGLAYFLGQWSAFLQLLPAEFYMPDDTWGMAYGLVFLLGITSPLHGFSPFNYFGRRR